MISPTKKDCPFGENDGVKVRCTQCGAIFPREEKPEVSPGRVRETASGYNNRKSKTVIVRCPHCGAVNIVDEEMLNNMKREAESLPCFAGPVNRETMRKNIITALEHFYPRYRAYNGGFLAPVRDPNPDLFMKVLTDLEREDLIKPVKNKLG